MHIETMSATVISGSGKPLDLLFHTGDPPTLDPVLCPIRIENWRFSKGCLLALIQEGSVQIRAHMYPIEVVGPQAFCEGDSVTPQSPAGLMQYSWSSGESSATIIVKQSGSYHFTARGVASGNVVASDTIQVTIWPRPAPVLSVTGTQMLCDGDSLILATSAGFSNYMWNNGALGSSVVVKNAGTYFVTVTDINGCIGVSEPLVVQLLSKPSPIITSVGSTTLCSGDSVLLDAGSGYASYLWSTGETNQSIAISESGRYDVRVRNTAGCEKDTFVIAAQFPPAPTPILTLNGAVMSCNAAAEYQWLFEGTEIPGATNEYLEVNTPGRYGVRTSDMNGCTASAEMSVNLASSVITLTCPEYREYEPGEIVIVPLILTSTNLTSTDPAQLQGMLRFNKSILKPLWTFTSSKEEGKYRTVSFSAARQPLQTDGLMFELPFRVMLGDEEQTELLIDSLIWVDGLLPIASGTGSCVLRVKVCLEGGARLYLPGAMTKLHQNHPNPFNAMTVIEYETAESGYVEVNILDALGRQVAMPVAGIKPAGKHVLRLDATGYRSGIYICVLKTATEQHSIILSLLR